MATISEYTPYVLTTIKSELTFNALAPVCDGYGIHGDGMHDIPRINSIVLEILDELDRINKDKPLTDDKYIYIYIYMNMIIITYLKLKNSFNMDLHMFVPDQKKHLL